MDLDKEMQRALETDGEKLRQLTGEDHGPHSLVMIPCRECGSEGRIYRAGAVYEPGCAFSHSGEIDCGPCPVCDGTGHELVECSLATEEEVMAPWSRCPSTHCERRQECASPSDCIVKQKAER